MGSVSYRSLVLPATTALLLGAAHDAAAATISTTRPCLNSRSPGQFVGTGFAPGATVKLQGDKVVFEEGVAGADGSVAIPFTVPLTNARQEPFRYTATDGSTTAAGSSLLTRPGLELSASGAPTRLPQRYLLSGFEPGRTIYGHVRWGEKWRLTRKLGTATGPCGVLDVKAKLLRKTAGKRGRSVFLQFDQLAKPRLDTHQLAFARFTVSAATGGSPGRFLVVKRGYRERTGL